MLVTLAQKSRINNTPFIINDCFGTRAKSRLYYLILLLKCLAQKYAIWNARRVDIVLHQMKHKKCVHYSHKVAAKTNRAYG